MSKASMTENILQDDKEVFCNDICISPAPSSAEISIINIFFLTISLPVRGYKPLLHKV